MRDRLCRFLLGLSAAVLFFAGPLSAQTISGIIAGRATDPQQKALSSVSIIAHNPGTGRDFQASTDGQGYFRILEVPPGLYEVTALLGGFETQHHKDVRVDVNRTTVEDFPLKIQTEKESITVESTSPMSILDSPTLSSAFTEKQTVDLPIVTRDVNNLALLAPGVESVRTFSFASTLVPFSVNGSRGRDNNFTIDSVDNNEPLFGGAASQFTNSDIFSEYEISTNQLKAEFGRNSGGTINAITKSGSNNWHGTLFGFGQGDRFNAMNQVEKQALQTSPEPFYDTTAGLVLGGPIKKEKAFFLVSYQWDRLSDNLTDVFPVLTNYALPGANGLQTLQGLPTDPALQTYLAAASATKIPAIGAGAPCFAGPIPPSNSQASLYSVRNPCLVTSSGVPISPTVSSCNQIPAAAPTPGCTYFNVYNVPNANTFNLRDHQLSGRYDQRINNSNDFFARYLFDDVTSPSYPLNSAAVAAFSDVGLLPDWKTFNRNRTQSLLFDHRYSRVNSLNEFRISYSRVSQAQGAFAATKAEQSNASAIIADCYAANGQGCPGTNSIGTLGGGSGLFQSAGGLMSLGPDSSPSHISSNTYQIQDNYSYTYKQHSFKFGANFIKIDSNNFSAPDDLGYYLYTGDSIFNSVGCAAPGPPFCGQPGGPPVFLNGFQAFLTNPTTLAPNFFTGVAASTAAVIGQRLVNIKTNSQGVITGFAGCGAGCNTPNEIKIKEFDQFYFAQDDWRVKTNFTISLGLRYENYGQPINSVHDINKLAPFVNTDNKDFAPRLGFAYSPSKNWVVRGGYTISYNPPILDIPLGIWQSGPVSPLISTDNITLAQLQGTGSFPSRPFNPSDFNNSLPFFSRSNNGVFVPATVNSGLVQGCSQYYDLYDTEAPFFNYPHDHVPVGGRAYNSFAGVTFGGGGPTTGSTTPPNNPIQNCSDQNTVARNLKNPYYQSWSLGTQYELGSNYLLEVDYIGGKGTRLFQRVDLNPYQGWDTDCLGNLLNLYTTFGLQNLATPGQCRLPRVDNSHGDILQITNGGSSIYHALQASLTKRYSRTKYFGDVTFTAAYTWSHLIDNTSEIFGPGFRTIQPGDFADQSAKVAGFANGLGGLDLLFDPLANSPVESITPLSEFSNQTTRAERGSSSFDRRHRFVSSFLWEPFAGKNKWVSGWQLNGLFTFQSGQPFSPLNASLQGACGDATGGGFVGNVRPVIGNSKAPLNSVALIANDGFCVPPGTILNGGPGVQAPLSYVDLNGNPIDPKTAHFVQVPLGLPAYSPIQPNPGGKLNSISMVTSSGTETFTPAGRNILVGPKVTNLDLALFRNIKFNERVSLQLRWEVYDLLNHPNLGYFNGSPYVANAAGASAFAYSVQRTGASITGGIPENAIDAKDNSCTAPPTPMLCPSTGRKGYNTFLGTSTMNTGNRRMQFGLRFIF